MKYKAIIFDMDGTITDSEHAWRKATRDLVIHKGGIFTEEKYNELENELKGLALPKSCKLLKDLIGIEDTVEELIEEKRNRALKLLTESLNFINGFESFHKSLVNKNILTGIATNADDSTLTISKNKLSLESFFGEHIYNISDVKESKPHPELYLYAANKLSIEPNYCIAIEDSAHGVRAAKQAGMFCIGINTANNRDALHESDLIIDHYDEIELERLLRRKGIK